ncbi:uncharacterized protein LOC129853314 [Salvelinus fontinalis]|uniref:uncharacterized protein LOC129853314 n=1 Tax=Salvelinus fontinalis TaxID=8038 RepID=UPI002485EAAF|nr:uncharacterized protein LOC129853314 [Salvelinus fontinalis]
MGSLASEVLDEAHCFWAMCAHPCCWESEQRIAKGVPHYIKPRTSDGGRATVDVEEFPTLSVVNVSEWTEGQKTPKVKLLYKTLSKENFATDASLTLLSSQSQAHQREHNTSADLHVPGLNSVDHSPRNKQHKEVKLSTAQINQLASCSSASWGSGSLVMWVPNSQHIPQCQAQNRPKSPYVPVKELICLPSLKTSKIIRNPRIQVQESKDVRKRVPFQLTTLTSKPRSEHGLSSPVAQQTVHPTDLALAKPDTDTDPKREEDEAQTQAHTSPHPPPEPRIPSAFLLRNKPVVFHSVRERVLRRHTQQDLSTYKYKLDSKTGGGGIDWDSLRRQTYLWRKHNLPPNRDREKPFPPEDMTVSQTGFGFYPIPKAMLHHDPRSPLSKGPAVWRCLECVDGMWCGHGGGPLASISKCLNSLVSNSSYKFCSRSKLSCQNPLHQLLDGDYLSDVDPGNKGTIAPQNSMMYLQDTASHYSDCQGEDKEFGLCPERDAEGGLGALERPGRSS